MVLWRHEDKHLPERLALYPVLLSGIYFLPHQCFFFFPSHIFNLPTLHNHNASISLNSCLLANRS